MQLAGIILKVHYPKMAVICGVEHTMLLFFNDFSNIPIVNHMISANNMICNFFGSHSIFKSKSQNFHSRNIGLFSGNETKTAGHFMGMHRDSLNTGSFSSHYIVC